MKIVQLQCFVTLEKHRSFSQAADNLFISQSSLSKHIKSLEEELGVKLFKRNTRRIELTFVGSQILLSAKRIIKDYHQILSDIEEFSDKTKNKIRVCAMCEMSQFGITEMIIAFEKKLINIHAEIKERDHQSMLDCLDARMSDVAVGFLELWPKSSAYIAHPLEKDNLVLVTSSKHLLAKREKIDLYEASSEKFCFPREDPAMFQFIIMQCEKAGFSPEITFSEVRLNTIQRYVAQGLRLTILTRKRAENLFNSPEYSIIPLKNSVSLTLSLYTRNESPAPIQKQFIQHARKYFLNKQ